MGKRKYCWKDKEREKWEIVIKNKYKKERRKNKMKKKEHQLIPKTRWKEKPTETKIEKKRRHDKRLKGKCRAEKCVR